MPGFFFPLIRPEDYQAFRDILGDDIPDAFDKWANHIAKERARLRREWERSDAIDVEVIPDQFVRHCDETNSKTSLTGLADEGLFIETSRAVQERASETADPIWAGLPEQR
jgi:hypothetical protein